LNPRVRLAAALVFLLNLLLNWRILLPGATPYRGSIESGYAYMARLFADNPDYLSWNPLQYGGLPMHYVYLPVLPYLDAIFLWLLPSTDPVHVHRAICALALFLAPSVILLFITDWTGRLRPAVYAGLAVSLCSPLYDLIETIRLDRGLMQVPWRIQVLIKYGEGPHTAGIVFLFAALFLVRRAATRPGWATLLAAAVALALTVLTNWVAGLALAFAVLMLMAVHLGDGQFLQRRVLLAGVLGYLLAAFWLTPSFIAQMAYNWPQDAFGYQFQRVERLAMIGWAAGLVIILLAFRRWPHLRYTAWVALCLFGFGLPVMLFYRYGINPLPESRRYALEFEIFLLLFALEIIRLLRASPARTLRLAGWAVLLAGLLQQTPHITKYLPHLYAKWQLTDKAQTSEYRIATALRDLHPSGRVFATGGTRFHLNSWFPIPQIGGVFETGLKTRLPLNIAYSVRSGLGLDPAHEAEQSILLLRTLAVEYIVVNGPNSQDFYRDYKNPRKFDGVLEKVWERDDDSIYRLGPVRYAHLLKPEEIPTESPKDDNRRPWYPYVNAMLDPARPVLQFQWRNARRATVAGPLAQGAHVAFAIPWDPNFRAYQNGQPVPVRANATTLMIAGPLPADSQELELRFEPSTEELSCAAISIAAALASAVLLFRQRRAA